MNASLLVECIFFVFVAGKITDIANTSTASGADVYLLSIIPRWTVNNEIKATSTILENSSYKYINTYDAIDSISENSEYNDYVPTYYLDGTHPTDSVNSIIGEYVARNILSTSNLYYGVGQSYIINSTGHITNGRDVYSTDAAIPFNVTPTADSINISVSAWTPNQKIWNESSESPDISVTHTIGDLPADANITIYRDGEYYDTTTTNNTGYTEWVYDGGFSEHTFEINESPKTIQSNLAQFFNSIYNTFYRTIFQLPMRLI